jgi:lambda family phage minor tail protein L
MSLENDVKRGWHEAIVELYEIDLSTIGTGLSDKFFLTNQTMPDNSAVRFKGKTYTAFPIEAGGFDKNTSGQFARPEITVSNVFGTFSAAIASAEDLVGAKVTRRRTLFKYLDNGPDPDSSQEFPEDVFFIERKSAETNLTVTWQLASRIDVEGILLPRRVITQDACVWRYRGPECGYSGPPVANEFDGAPEGSSGAAQAYINALRALLEANARLNSAIAELANAEAAEEVVCDIDIIKEGEPEFNLRDSNGPYTFGILQGGQYFAAYKDDTLVPPGKFGFDKPVGEGEVGDAAFGDPQNTGRGPNGNGTGPLFAINLFQAIRDPETGEVTDVVLVSSTYDPPRTFAFRDLEGEFVICIDGTIRREGPIKEQTEPGQVPPTDAFGGLGGQEFAFAVGDREDRNAGPVTDLRFLELSSAQCDAATGRTEDAQAELDAATAAQAAAQAAFNAALAALPANDPLRASDQCGKRLTSCRLRFGTSTLPFGGFPGANLFQ